MLTNIHIPGQLSINKVKIKNLNRTMIINQNLINIYHNYNIVIQVKINDIYPKNTNYY